MEIKCGIDIIEISRIKKSIEDLGEKFLNKVYTEEEIIYCESRKKQKYQHYAARFAAKEATFKAISDKLDDKYELSWKDYEVINNKNGQPIMKLHKIDKNIEKAIENIDISLAHCKEYATANVAILFK